jgi:hypothetical protein
VLYAKTNLNRHPAVRRIVIRMRSIALRDIAENLTRNRADVNRCGRSG